MTDLRTAAQQALEALVAAYQGKDKQGQVIDAITALKAALAEPVQDGKCQLCTDGCPACDARKLADQLLEDQIVYGTAILQGGKRVDPKLIFKAEPITDAMMNLVDRLGSEADQVDPRAWHHLLVYAPKQKPSQEPVGWFGYDNSIGTWFETNEGDDDSVLLYTAPPQRKPLTEEEIQAIWAKTFEQGSSANTFARAIERAHGIGDDK